MAKPEEQIAEPMRRARDACRELLLWAVAFSAGVNLLYLAPSIYMMQVYDRVLMTGGLWTLAFVSLVLVFALATLALLDAIRMRVLMRGGLRLDRLLTPLLLNLALSADPRRADARRLQAVREFDTLRQAVAGPAAIAAIDILWAPIFVLVCFLLHVWIGVLVLAGGALLLALALRNEQALRELTARSAEQAPRFYAAQEADSQFSDVARALGMRGGLVARQLSARQDLNATQAESSMRAIRYQSAIKWLRLILQSAALGLGAYLAIERQISPGAIIAASILTARALAPLEQIVGAWRQIGQARAAYRALNALLLQTPEAPPRTALPTPRGVLSLERAGVAAPDGQRPILYDVTFTLQPGEIIGVLGPSGAGKSTLARIAAGAAPPNAGIVRIDGANVKDWDSDALGAHIGYLPQDVALFAGTVAENIRRFAARGEDSTDIDAALVAAARAAGAHDMILRLPNGYDTELGHNGRGLSFGQAQRIGLARALFRDPALLVLDEPNAHLDQEGEAALTEALRAARARGAAVLVVAHRANFLAAADKLIVMQEGRIALAGTSEEVRARLAQAQGAPAFSTGGIGLSVVRPADVRT